MLNLRVVTFIFVSLFIVGCGEVSISKVTMTPTNAPVQNQNAPPSSSGGSLGVRIASPQDGAAVTSTVDLSFTVSGDIPNGFKPVVVIRDPLGQFWPWLHVQDQGRGNWILPGVTLGNESDCGKSFGLIVIITAETVPAGKIPALPDGEKDDVTVTKTCG